MSGEAQTGIPMTTVSAAPPDVGLPALQTHRDAAVRLAERDPVIARLVDAQGLPEFFPPTETPFAALVRAITYQQLATPAARAIHGRLVAALGGQVTPERLLALPQPDLRGVGLSVRKTESLRDLAGKVVDGAVELDPTALVERDDESIVAALSTVRGIGKWTAEMFLMFQLLRLDVWPTGDLAVRKGYALGWAVPLPTPKQLDAAGEVLRPYRSIAAWYCWVVAAQPGSAGVTSADPLPSTEKEPNP
jgi:DNA-3-methyladenine glycosylase II